MATRRLSSLRQRAQGKRLGRILSTKFDLKKKSRVGTIIGSGNAIDVEGTVYDFVNTSGLSLSAGDSITVVNVGRKAAAIYAPGSGGGISSGSSTTVRSTSSASGGGSADHGGLSGLTDDDHPQYLTETRGDARYYTRSSLAGDTTGDMLFWNGSGYTAGNPVIDAQGNIITQNGLIVYS